MATLERCNEYGKKWFAIIARMRDACLRFDNFKLLNDLENFFEFHENLSHHSSTHEAVSGLAKGKLNDQTAETFDLLVGLLQRVSPAGPTQPAIAAAPAQLALPAPAPPKHSARGKKVKDKKCTICHKRVQYAQTAVCSCVVYPTLLLTLIRTHPYMPPQLALKSFETFVIKTGGRKGIRRACKSCRTASGLVRASASACCCCSCCCCCCCCC